MKYGIRFGLNEEMARAICNQILSIYIKNLDNLRFCEEAEVKKVISESLCDNRDRLKLEINRLIDNITDALIL